MYMCTHICTYVSRLCYELKENVMGFCVDKGDGRLLREAFILVSAPLSFCYAFLG